MSGRGIVLGWLLAMVAAGAVVAVEPRGDSPSASDVESRPRSLSAIQVDVHAALRAEALSRRRGENVAEVMRLVDLYREMAAHPRRGESGVLKELGWKLRSRLEKVRDHIERQSARSDRDAKKNGIAPARVVPEAHILAQQIPGPGGAAGGQGAQGAAGQPGGVQTIDYGPELLDVIQRTISPATWDINGGIGAVVYFAPLRALVVSAPEGVHSQVGDLLGQLRAAP